MANTPNSEVNNIFGEIDGNSIMSPRAASIQATSFLSASSNFTIGATQTAWALEVTNTLIALGAWKGAA